MARSCKAAGARPLSAAECQQAAGRQGYGRKWLGTTASATEAAGCVLWEEHGNVEYNAKTEQPLCNVRGTCLCKGSDGREVHIIGMPNNGKGVEGRELQAGSSSRGSRWRILIHPLENRHGDDDRRQCRAKCRVFCV
jgi:hypothetical protein